MVSQDVLGMSSSFSKCSVVDQYEDRVLVGLEGQLTRHHRTKATVDVGIDGEGAECIWGENVTFRRAGCSLLVAFLVVLVLGIVQ